MTKMFVRAATLALFASFAIHGQAAEPKQVDAESAAVIQAAAVSLNTADAETLTRELTGIGATKAKAIVDYRDTHGPFTSVDELLEVKGIGAATLEKNRSRLSL
ncbi:ComEA family DNA-binding protein [Stutzerimonas azotifigens]|uniref:Helix-hairpin-helix domain-containing protein n=1 Tax=Stutzerimonas azotifigens TaxID=291995 RepID=A0ABR5YXI0_9GAMM|nr:helix-hairpin-helix domain-containing protein [Stutzerimonas azotifigens]MBA1272639.1 helix-hairpin-helix domain-containing protein [Stutzerimonas azotifigens]